MTQLQLQKCVKLTGDDEGLPHTLRPPGSEPRLRRCFNPRRCWNQTKILPQDDDGSRQKTDLRESGEAVEKVLLPGASFRFGV